MSAFRIIFLSFFLLASFVLYGQTRVVKLQIDLLPKLKSALSNAEIDLGLVGHNTHKYLTVKNPGLILFDSLAEKELSVSFSCYANIAGFPKEYRMITEVNSYPIDSANTVHITFPENCDFNNNSISNICPKCLKKDKVIPILYGLRVPIFDSLGNVIKPDPKKYYSGGCNVTNCDPTWYCERDKLSF